MDAKKSDWQHAHEIAQKIPGASGAWIHAYLHRVEGDLGNARYWYQRAKKPVASGSFSTEWESLVRHFLKLD